MNRLYSTSIKQVSKQTATGKCAHSITLFDRGTRFPKLSQLSWTVVIQTQDDPSLHADKLVHQRWFARIGNAKHSNLPAAINLLDVYGLHQCINICWQMPAENVSPSFSTGLGVFFHRLNGSFIDLQNASKGYKTLSLWPLWVQVTTEYLQDLARHLQGINDQEYFLSLLPASLGWLSSDWGFEACRQSDEMITEPFGDWNLTVDWLVTQKHTQNTKDIRGEWLVGSKRSCQYSRLKTTFNVLLACCNEVSCVTSSATKGISDSRAKFQEPRA